MLIRGRSEVAAAQPLTALPGPAAAIEPGRGSSTSRSSGARDTARAAGRWAAAASLLLLVALTSSLVIIAASRPGPLARVPIPGFFPSWIAGPLGGLWPGPTHSLAALERIASGVMIGMLACYLGALRYAALLRARWTIATILALHAVLLVSPPLLSSDVFNYINYGRMAAVEHLNPYTTIPQLGSHADLGFALSNWHGLLSPYGPLFTHLTEAITPLGIPASLWTLKLLDGLADLGTLALIWRCAPRLGRPPVQALAFVAFNPVVLVWGLGSVHYDSLMMFFVVGAVYLLVEARSADGASRRTARLELAAGAALAVAIAIKLTAALLLPVFLLSSRRRWVICGFLPALGVLALTSLASFGVHLPALGAQTRLVNTRAVPDVTGYLLGAGGETHAMHAALTGVFIVAVVACSMWAWRMPDQWLTAAGALMVVLVVTMSWSVPWYVLWILPFAALSTRTSLRVATLVLTAYYLVLFMPAEAALAHLVGFQPDATSIGRAAGRAVQALGG